MISAVFEEVLRDMDTYFRLQDKKILLLVDNAPSHFDPHYHLPEFEQDEQNVDEEEPAPTTARGRRRTETARGMLLKLNIFANY